MQEQNTCRLILHFNVLYSEHPKFSPRRRDVLAVSLNEVGLKRSQSKSLRLPHTFRQQVKHSAKVGCRAATESNDRPACDLAVCTSTLQCSLESGSAEYLRVERTQTLRLTVLTANVY